MPRHGAALPTCLVVGTLLGAAALPGQADGGRPVITGQVRAPDGRALVGATVTGDDGRTVRTDADGRFALRIDDCTLTRLSVRRPGMIGVTRLLEPCAPGTGELAIVLRPMESALDTVRIRARVSGIVGTLVDHRGDPLGGARVQLLGMGAPVRSDAAGRFTILDVRPGAWLLSVDDPRVESRRVSVTLGDADVRELVLPLRSRLAGSDTTRAAVEVAAARDFATRRTVISDWHVTVGREELAGAGDSDLSCALAQLPKVRRVFGTLSVVNCNEWSVPPGCIVVDGWRDGVRPLNWLDTREVEFVELYRGAPARSPAVSSRSTCPDTLPLAIVWMR
ncbi:MAG: carboxypeptidase-like regulatory domain-containing protein [Gemmatimonadaceae bacterium]|nr:carboxypeptidase-like regulatory domain-containing protein [Gemmatimonadaceae bacterium]